MSCSVLNTVPKDIGMTVWSLHDRLVDALMREHVVARRICTTIGVLETTAAMSLKWTVCTCAGSAPIPIGPKRDRPRRS